MLLFSHENGVILFLIVVVFLVVCWPVILEIRSLFDEGALLTCLFEAGDLVTCVWVDELEGLGGRFAADEKVLALWVIDVMPIVLRLITILT